MNSGIKKTLLGLSLALASTVALAAVTFDPATGTGFVGKGDVQLAFDWNNAALQANAGSVTFTYGLKTTFNVTCEWETFTNSSGNGQKESKTIEHVETEGFNINTRITVGSASRLNPQGAVTGFNLTGIGGIAPTAGVPAVGDTEFCNANDMGPGETKPSHTVSTVTSVAVAANGEAAGLFVNFGDESVQLNY